MPPTASTNPSSLFRKRIIGVSLDNYRGFYGVYEPLRLEKGQNCLIYGENGSGKSSLFKGLNDYLARSRDKTKSFICNRYANVPQGSIRIEFADFSTTTLQEIAGSRVEYEFGTLNTNNEVSFIQDAALINGFLEYRDLLDVYLHKEPQPNLFQLIVLRLLANHIPLRSGGSFRFGSKWTQLKDDLLNCRTRNDRRHKTALAELPSFQTHLESSLQSIFLELNRLLNTFFSNLHLQVDYTLKNISFTYHRNKANWNVVTDLRLLVIKDGVRIVGDYSDILNEARLSAFAICLYLASLKLNPSLLDLKLLYLDDIFIGLDAGNRIPILEIMKTEFADYQIIISTYDRHWFELAKKYFEINDAGKWLATELYVGRGKEGAVAFDKPSIVVGSSSLEKAIQYLHHRSNPDYPAAANYFRKSIEELISNFVPLYELADTDNSQLPDYKLTKTIQRTHRFLKKTGNDTTAINLIMSLLHGLIHPLSHHSISSQIYKGELILIETAIQDLRGLLVKLDIANNYKCILESGKKIKITFCVDQVANHYFFYELLLKEPLILKRNSAGGLSLCDAECVADRYYGHNGVKKYKSGNADRKNPKYNYDSLKGAYHSIYDYLKTVEPSLPQAPNGYESVCEYSNGSVWTDLTTLIVW